MSVNWYWVASATLVIGLGIFHSVLGERYIVRRLLRRDNLPHLFGDDSFTKLTIRYAWHITTILCVVVGTLLLVGATRTEPAWDTLGWIVSAALGVMAIWAVLSTRARHLSWFVLVAAAALAGIGSF